MPEVTISRRSARVYNGLKSVQLAGEIFSDTIIRIAANDNN